MFAMMSFGDDSVNKGRGPYVFKMSSQIYHWIDSLCLEEGHNPRFLQLYIYDTQDEVNNIMQHFSGLDEGTLNLEIVQGLIHVLDEHNGLVRLFRTVRDKCNAGEIPGFKIRLYNMGSIHGYEFPTSKILIGIVFKSGPRSQTDFDVIIEFRGEPPQSLYDAVSRGDREGIAAGSKIMLPSTFIGGPQYMYSYYLDALAIFRSMGNP
ncbi:hypothetical protein Tco_0469136 [Tanacetum coccineum]